MVFLGVNKAQKLYVSLWLGRSFGHVHHVEIVVELSVEASEHDEALAHEDARVSPTRFWEGVTHLQLCPDLRV